MHKFFLKNYKVGLDIDEVLADFLGGYEKWTGTSCKEAKNFYFSYEADEIIKGLPDEFWENLLPKIKPEDLNFLPACYISKRKFDEGVTKRWLEKNGFPCMPVYHVREKSKVSTVLNASIDFYVDDYIFNFQDLNANGITTFLMDCSHNRQFDVGDYRLNHIRELIHKIEKYIEDGQGTEKSKDNKIITKV
jgi:hypothetical protein